jgi:hypothetical protein
MIGACRVVPKVLPRYMRPGLGALPFFSDRAAEPQRQPTGVAPNASRSKQPISLNPEHYRQ